MSDPTKYGPLREFQQQLYDVGSQIALGLRQQRVVVADITPGGGKTLGAAFTRLALDRRAPAIRWALGMLTAAERASLVET